MASPATPSTQDRLERLEGRVDLGLDHLVSLSATMVRRFNEVDARFDEMVSLLRVR